VSHIFCWTRGASSSGKIFDPEGVFIERPWAWARFLRPPPTDHRKNDRDPARVNLPALHPKRLRQKIALRAPDRSWLRSNNIRVVFLYSSWIVLCMGLLMTFMLTPWFQEIEAVPTYDLVLRIFAFPLALLGAPASLVLWFGMVAFLIREDRSPGRVKVLWFVLFFTPSIFGAAFHFFKVCRKQVQDATSS
jgi:hypothetical protein